MRLLSAFFLCLIPIAPALAAPTHITFVTDWKAQAEHGGFYEALAEGFYAKRGLDVTIREGGPQVNVPQLLAGGAADFGIGSNNRISLNMVKQKCADPRHHGDLRKRSAGPDQPSGVPRPCFAGGNARAASILISVAREAAASGPG